MQCNHQFFSTLIFLFVYKDWNPLYFLLKSLFVFVYNISIFYTFFGGGGVESTLADPGSQIL